MFFFQYRLLCLLSCLRDFVWYQWVCSVVSIIAIVAVTSIILQRRVLMCQKKPMMP